MNIIIKWDINRITKGLEKILTEKKQTNNKSKKRKRLLSLEPEKGEEGGSFDIFQNK